MKSKFSLWRLNHLKDENGKSTDQIMQFIHQESLSHSLFSVKNVFISEKYIVPIFHRTLDNESHMKEIFIQVRSTLDFNVIYSYPKERVDFIICFAFVNDILATQVFQDFKHQEISFKYLKPSFIFLLQGLFYFSLFLKGSMTVTENLLCFYTSKVIGSFSLGY